MRLGVLVAVGAAAGVVVAAVMGSGAAGTATATLTPVADSYVRADRPLANFGKASSFEIAGRPVSNAYLRFRVTVPAGQTVARATLQLFASSKSTAGFTVHRVANTTWGETTTTYANAPPIRARVAASGAHRGKAYVSVDVTSLVTRSGLVSLAVKGVSPSPLGFRSRESSSGRPRLVVETSVRPCAGAVYALARRPHARRRRHRRRRRHAAPAAAPAAAPCGTVTTPPRRVDHVIWIWMENKPYDAVIGSSSAPYENAARGRVRARDELPRGHAIRACRTTSRRRPEARRGSRTTTRRRRTRSTSRASTARSRPRARRGATTQESAPGNCPLTSSGQYAVKHDPAPYYTGIRSDCAAWDVPMGTTASGNFLTDLTGGTLPAFSFVTPDLCNDTHDCPVATGDAWLKSWFAKILASPTYLAGRTVVFVTWDEDDGSASNRVPLIVVSPSTPAGTRSGTFFDHYSLLKTTEQLLGITTFLGHAGDAGTSSMVSTFNLG